ncbi:DNA-binding MarR family transcriptional regulator [Actinoplanes campanulatus]|uniref:DNA-binding MarR family transcriptional regulator n=1 Tax=Actinoplanes campanulatus TaxID=113559 RepID=A0A7W5AMJ7_9ACTN|nr:MarR family transcriptional regulator [Actinoplanes campanulatus]MBB3098825.1 DNA-binding MarR family transcriptional regulator [Actinoplanes campanulatus]GGN36845.1 MarR family transcriptional regulator [Actinoplanes campanulatus]GID42656.1 MarR family transcriptional regulator [Actinoplanes campanulatus]
MDEPRWLTDEQQQAWRQVIEVLVRVPAALEAQLQRDAGLTHMGYLVLMTLSERSDRRLSMSNLAKRASASLSRLSHVVARLEEKGWVQRERDAADGRVQIAVLTDAGWEKVVESAPGHAEAVQQLIFDRLTPGQARQLAKVAEALLETPLEVRSRPVSR